MAVQEVRWGRGGDEPAEDYAVLYVRELYW